jgi:hypothetical protein
MGTRKNLLLGLGVVLLTVLGSVSVAEAQGYPPPYYPPPPPPPPPPHGVYRAGLIWGFSLGLGSVQTSLGGCGDACGAAGVGEAHIGGMISPRAALMFEIWGADHPWTGGYGNTSQETINSFFTGAAQYWITDILWIKGGVGLAELRNTVTDNYTGYAVSASTGGFGFFGAGGIEVLQTYNFALDLQLRIGDAFYNQNSVSFSYQNYALTVGFNWY